MTPPIDRQSPVPLYHQIMEVIRYRIATGAIRPGAVLPPLREAAKVWGANLHTVRRAYAELARGGFVATRVPQGTVVLPRPDPPKGRKGGRSLNDFLQRVVQEARQAHGLGSDELIRLLGPRSLADTDVPSVFACECSETESRDLAGQLMERWMVSAQPWPIDRPPPPGGGPIIATYFHYRDIASRWPSRLADVHFMAIHPDPALGHRLSKLAGGRGKQINVVLCEREESMLSNIAVDLSGILPADRFRIKRQVVSEPFPWLSRSRTRLPVLFSPRLWGELPEEGRRDPRAVEVRYIFEPRELETIGSDLGWRPQ